MRQKHRKQFGISLPILFVEIIDDMEKADEIDYRNDFIVCAVQEKLESMGKLDGVKRWR